MDLPSVAPEILRVLCGLWFVPHLIGKATHYGKAAGTFEAAGFHPGRAFVGATIALELAALIGLVFGVYPRLAALCAVAVLLGAGYAVVRINGWNWRWQKLGPEYPIFWAVACLLTTL
jgi:putative oxidoreductase